MQHEDLLVMLMADPLDQRLLDELRFMTQRRIVPVLAAPGRLPMLPSLPSSRFTWYDGLGNGLPSLGVRM